MFKYPETKDYIETNLKEVCKAEGLTPEEVIYFVVCIWAIERINGLLLH